MLAANANLEISPYRTALLNAYFYELPYPLLIKLNKGITIKDAFLYIYREKFP